jgi:hypothetical protein
VPRAERLRAGPGAPELAALGTAVAGVNLLAAGGVSAALAGAGLLATVALAMDLRATAHRPADRQDWAAFMLSVPLAAFRARGAALCALLPLAAMALRGGDAAGRGAALLLAALTAAGLSEGSVAGLIAPLVLAMEAEAVRLLLILCGLAAEASGNTVGLPELARRLVILRGCSSLAMLPPLVLAGIGLARLIAPDRPVPAARLLGAAGIAVLLNLVRLCAMAVSPAAATFFHAPPGEALLQVAWLAIALAAAWPSRR